jgi:hypothetical protein
LTKSIKSIEKGSLIKDRTTMFKWSLFVDIEGFSQMFQTGDGGRGLRLLRDLTRDLFKMGREFYPGESDRLFIYNFGDGFSVHPDFGDETLTRPVAIGIALMRLTLKRGGVARVSISQGSMTDILDCFPGEVIREKRDNTVSLGAGGLMTLNQVMGEGLINAYGVSKLEPKGPRILLDKNFPQAALPSNIHLTTWKDSFEVDWVYSEMDLANQIINKIAGEPISSNEVEQLIKAYIQSNRSLPKNIKRNIESLLRRKSNDTAFLVMLGVGIFFSVWGIKQLKKWYQGRSD